MNLQIAPCHILLASQQYLDIDIVLHKASFLVKLHLPKMIFRDS